MVHLIEIYLFQIINFNKFGRSVTFFLFVLFIQTRVLSGGYVKNIGQQLTTGCQLIGRVRVWKWRFIYYFLLVINDFGDNEKAKVLSKLIAETTNSFLSIWYRKWFVFVCGIGGYHIWVLWLIYFISHNRFQQDKWFVVEWKLRQIK